MLRASLRVVLLLAFLVPASVQAQTKLYAGPQTEPLYLDVAPKLMTAVFPEHRLNLRATSGGLESLQHVLEDVDAVGLLQRDLLRDHLSRHPDDTDRLVAFGTLGLRCLYGVVREGGWVASFDDLLRSREDGSLLVDVGPPEGDAAATFSAMRALEPDLAEVKLEHRGDLRALHMVEAGLTDVAFFVETPSLDSNLLAKVNSSDILTLLPIISRSLLASRAEEEAEGSYLYTRVVVERKPWRRSDTTYETLCTPLTVVANSNSKAELLDALAFAVISQDFEPSDPSLTERLLMNTQKVGDRVIRLIEGF